MPLLNVEEIEIPYEIRRSHRAKRSRIIISYEKVEVVAPKRMSERGILRFVDEHKDWIRNKYGEIKARAANMPRPLPEIFEEGRKVMFQGDEIPLYIAEKGVGVMEHKDGLLLPASLSKRQPALIKWLKEQAKESAEFYAEKHKGKFNLHVGDIRIRAQKQRWGSCSQHNNININWQLIFYPPEIMEYVMVHELCHIRHKNHSKDFWNFVGEHLPDYKEKRKFLRKNTTILEFPTS